MREADKGLVEFDGGPLVAHVAARLAPQVEAVLVSANRNADRYAAYGRVVADDPAFGAWAGPLAGVAAGLAAWPGAWVVTAPCDTPFLPVDLAARLLAAAQERGAPLAVAAAGGRRHSVCMAVRTNLLDDLRDYLRGGDRKVDLWQSRVGGVEVDFGDAGAFLNINTPDDLDKASRSGGRQ
jgi:molybdopterin-guanine dinucleotide biosynthesis protein A